MYNLTFIAMKTRQCNLNQSIVYREKVKIFCSCSALIWLRLSIVGKITLINIYKLLLNNK